MALSISHKSDVRDRDGQFYERADLTMHSNFRVRRFASRKSCR